MSLPDDIVREIRRTTKPTKTRANHGQWVEPAKAALALVNSGEGWTVTEAVKAVISRLKLHPADRAFTAIRAAYYEAKNKSQNQ